MMGLPEGIELPDPEHSWARVELYLWQHGALPPQDGPCEELVESEALRTLSSRAWKGLEEGSLEELPSPVSIVSVLRYLASRLEKLEKFEQSELERADG